MSVDSSNVAIRLATQHDFENTVELLTQTLTTDPVLSWLVDDAAERFEVLRGFFSLYMRLGLEKGTVYIAETDNVGLAGVSIWCPNGAMDAEAEQELERFSGVHFDKFAELAGALDKHYPPADNYDQLMVVAVVEEAHGLGIGSKLLAPHLQKMDEQGIPTYLEATSRLAAGGVYERLGYQPVGEPVRFPNGSRIYPMWRNLHSVDTFTRNYTNSHEIVDRVIRFGQHDYKILEVQGNKALILAHNVLKNLPYHDTFEETAWVRCSLRSYLNESFYQQFSDEEKARILDTPLPSMNNPWFGTDAGKSTTDKIFVLSVEEVVRYFGDSQQLQDKNKHTKYFINDAFNNVRKTFNLNNERSCWWLRCPGNSKFFATHVMNDGRISIGGDFVNRQNAFNIGVRPAMWIDITDLY